MSEKYNLKISQDLVDVFQEYIDDHPELGYTFVSEFMRDILREHSIELKKEQSKSASSPQTIQIKGGSYTKEELLHLLEKRGED